MIQLCHGPARSSRVHLQDQRYNRLHLAGLFRPGYTRTHHAEPSIRECPRRRPGCRFQRLPAQRKPTGSGSFSEKESLSSKLQLTFCEKPIPHVKRSSSPVYPARATPLILPFLKMRFWILPSLSRLQDGTSVLCRRQLLRQLSFLGDTCKVYLEACKGGASSLHM